MIVCQCKGITDRQLRAIVRLGYDSAERVASACGAGTECGGCLPTIAAIVAQERLLMDCERQRPAQPVPVPQQR